MAKQKTVRLPGSTEVKHLLYALVTDYGLEEFNNGYTSAEWAALCGVLWLLFARAQKSMPYDDPTRSNGECVSSRRCNADLLQRANTVLWVAPASYMLLRNLSRWRGCIFRKRSSRVQIV